MTQLHCSRNPRKYIKRKQIMQLQERNEQTNGHLIDVNNLPTFTMSETTSTSMRLNKPILRKGDTGEGVEELQKLLKYWDLYYDIIDGIFSEYVEWAVKGYQHRVFLEEDGIVGSLTWKALYSGASGSTYPSSQWW